MPDKQENTTTAELKRLLGRFKRTDYKDIVQTWVTPVGLLAESPHFRSFLDPDCDKPLEAIPKKDFTFRVLKAFGRQGPQRNDVAELDLMFIQKYSTQRLWRVYNIQGNKGMKTPEPKLLLSQLRHELQYYFHHVDLHLAVNGPVYWLRLKVHESQQDCRLLPLAGPTYLLHHPHTAHVLVANLKVRQAEYIMQALLNVMKGTSLKPSDLSGHCAQSLFQIILHPQSQGSFSQFRLNQVENDPLRRGRKRKRPQSDEDREELHSHIANENTADKAEREALLERAFGSNPQPRLEKVDYVLETKFKGHRYVPAMARKEGLFRCKVSFQGPSVLEGIRQLGKAGLAALPMKDHVGKIPSLGRNSFLLRQKGLSESQSQLAGNKE